MPSPPVSATVNRVLLAPSTTPMRCPEPEIVIKEVHKQTPEWGGPRPALSPIYGIYGNYNN